MISKTHIGKSILFILVVLLSLYTIFGYTSGDPPLFYIPFDDGFDIKSDLGLTLSYDRDVQYNQTDAVYGKSIYFDDGYLYFNFTGNTDLPSNGLGNNMTISLWYKRVSTTDESLIGYWFGNTYEGVEVFFNDQYNDDRINTMPYASYITNVRYPANATEWNHLAVVYNAPELSSLSPCVRFYRNGVAKDGSSCDLTGRSLYSGSNQFALGTSKSSLGTSNYFTGHMDEFAVFDYSLTESQVLDIYENGIVPVYDNFTLSFVDNTTLTSITDTIFIESNGVTYNTSTGTFTTPYTDGESYSFFITSDTYYPLNITYNDTSNPTTVTLYLESLPTPIAPSNTSELYDMFDGFTYDEAFDGLAVCPFDNGETDRTVYLFLLVFILTLQLLAFVFDHSILGLVSGLGFVYMGITFGACDVLVSGILVVWGLVYTYYAFTKLSMNGSDDYHV